MVENNEIITSANLFSFASQSYWPIREGGKNQIKELCYKGKEKHEEKREERQIGRERERERFMKEERPKLVTMRVWREKKWARDCFPRKFFGKQPIKNKPYFY